MREAAGIIEYTEHGNAAPESTSPPKVGSVERNLSVSLASKWGIWMELLKLEPGESDASNKIDSGSNDSSFSYVL